MLFILYLSQPVSGIYFGLSRSSSLTLFSQVKVLLQGMYFCSVSLLRITFYWEVCRLRMQRWVALQISNGAWYDLERPEEMSPTIVFCFFFLVSLGGVRLSPLGTSATVGLLYQPLMIDDDYGAVCGMRIGRGNRSTRRKPAPVPLCTAQIPHDLTWDRTRAAAVGSQRLTAWAMARPPRQ
jgi:hypothetical protein